MTYDISAIMRDAHGRTKRQWQRLGYTSYAAAFQVYLNQAWYAAKKARCASDIQDRVTVIAPGHWAYRELATDGRL